MLKPILVCYALFVSTAAPWTASGGYGSSSQGCCLQHVPTSFPPLFGDWLSLFAGSDMCWSNTTCSLHFLFLSIQTLHFLYFLAACSYACLDHLIYSWPTEMQMKVMWGLTLKKHPLWPSSSLFSCCGYLKAVCSAVMPPCMDEKYTLTLWSYWGLGFVYCGREH